MINKLRGFIGKPINDEDIQDYITEYKIKVPKRQTISRTSMTGSSSEIYFTEKVNSVEVSFSIRPKNPNIEPVPAKRAGTYYPVCTQVYISPNKNNLDLEVIHGLKLGMSVDEVDKRLSKLPDVKFTKTTSDSYTTFTFQDELNKNIEYYLQQYNGVPASSFIISSNVERYSTKMFPLYDPLDYFNVQGRYEAAPFVEWAIKDGAFIETPENKEGIALVKDSVISGIEFINKHIKDPAIYLGDFKPEAREFVEGWRYNRYSYLQRNVHYTYGYIDPDIIIHEIQKAYSAYKTNNEL